MEENINDQNQQQSQQQPVADYPEASLSDIQAAEARLAASIEALNGNKKKKKDKKKKPSDSGDEYVESPEYTTGKMSAGMKIFLTILIVAVLIGGGLCIYFFAIPDKGEQAAPYNIYVNDDRMGYVDCLYNEGSNELTMSAFSNGQATFLGWAKDNRYGNIVSTSQVMTVDYDKSTKYYAIFNLTLSTESKNGLLFILYDEARLASVDSMYTSETVVEVPEVLNLTNGVYRVYKIDDEAFAYSNIVKITLPKSIVSIGANAFIYSTVKKLDSTRLDNLTYIGEKAFFGCDELLAFYINKNVTYIGDQAFSYCDNLILSISEDNPKYTLSGNTIVEKDKLPLAF